MTQSQSTQSQSTGRSFILQAMVSMAAADGAIDESEMAAIRGVCARTTGESVSADDINAEPDGECVRSRIVAGRLATARGRLTREMKEAILGSAYRVLLADGRVAARERKTLMDFARALKISEIHRSIIFEDVERSLH